MSVWRPYRLEIRGILSPSGAFRIGSGQKLSSHTDMPVLRGADNRPYVPGSSLRGVLHHWLEDEAPLLGCDAGAVHSLFGETPAHGDALAATNNRFGRLVIEDACVSEESAAPGDEVRDHVKLERRSGSAAAGAKFDSEVAIEGQFEFRASYEGGGPGDFELILLYAALRRLENGGFSIGAQSGSGLGGVTLNRLEHRAWQRDQLEGLAAYFSRRLDHGDNWLEGLPIFLPAAAVQASSRARAVFEFDLLIQFEGPALVRASLPITEPDPMTGDPALPGTYAEKGEYVADSVFVTHGIPRQYYLPGSSLRGVLRSHAERIAETLGRGSAAVELFGPLLGARDQIKKRGLIQIGDGELEGSPDRVFLDHVAIDRITAAAEDGAKFCNSALVSPRFRVRVRLALPKVPDGPPNGAPPFTDPRSALALWGLVLRDLMAGRLWAGSGTTRGYGFIRSAKIETVRVEVPEGFGLELPGGTADAEQPGRRVSYFRTVERFSDLKSIWDFASGGWPLCQ